MPRSHAAALHHAPLAPRRPVPARDGLSTAQRRGVIGAIALAHVGAIWAILQVPAVREAVIEAAPMFVELLTPVAPPAPPLSPPPPPPALKALPPTVLAAPAVANAPAVFEVTPAPEEPAPPAAPVVQAPQAPAAAPPAAPKMIPASAVQYLETPLEYPRASRRLSEAGTVTLRVYIDERGHVASVQLSRSSGFSRLDEAALASVKKWRFKPYAENGQPLAGFAAIPVMFELEK